MSVLDKLEIGKPLSKKRPKDMFKLHVEVMHGDADHDEITTNLFLNEECDYNKPPYKKGLLELELYINLLAKKKGHYWQPTTKDVEDVLKNYPEEWDASDFLCDVIPNDITYHEVNAAVVDYHVTYFNKDGVEHEVKIK